MDTKDKTLSFTKPYKTLRLCKAISDITDILYKNNIKYEEYTEVFDLIDAYYKSVLEKEADGSTYPFEQFVVEPSSASLREDNLYW